MAAGINLTRQPAIPAATWAAVVQNKRPRAAGLLPAEVDSPSSVHPMIVHPLIARLSSVHPTIVNPSTIRRERTRHHTRKRTAAVVAAGSDSHRTLTMLPLRKRPGTTRVGTAAASLRLNCIGLSLRRESQTATHRLRRGASHATIRLRRGMTRAVRLQRRGRDHPAAAVLAVLTIATVVRHRVVVRHRMAAVDIVNRNRPPDPGTNALLPLECEG
jgi:hypothetical protein